MPEHQRLPTSLARPAVARLVALLVAAQLSPAHAACSSYALPGVNVSGGEYNASSTRYGYDYIYPGQAEFALMQNLQLKLMRVPFAWERIQPVASGALNADEMTRIDAVIAMAATNGVTVVLDPHNYGRYGGVSLSAANAPVGALPDLWRRLAQRYANKANVVFGMMNEPHDMDASTWASIAQQTLAAIRAAGAKNTVMIPGTNWDGAQSWFSKLGTASNADAMLPLARADDNVVFEVHQYFDDGYSGTVDTCNQATSAVASLGAISSWARTNHVRLFLGESGVSQRPECLTALNSALGVIEQNKDVWYGWTYWAAGAWQGTYMFNVESTSGQAAQGAILKSRASTLGGLSCPAPAATAAPAPTPAPAPVAATPVAAPKPAPAPVKARRGFWIFRWG